MPLSLPPPDERRLARSPLALVVCQVSFEELAAATDARLALSFHEELGGRSGLYPKLEPVKLQMVNVQGGPGGFQSAAQTRQGWRFQSTDGFWTVTLMPDHVALETSRYTTWSDDFQIRLANVIDAAAHLVEPAIEQRLGLRYVNRITEPVVKAAAEWRDYVASSFLGPVLDETLGEAVQAAQQQVDLSLDASVSCSVRHGFFNDPSRDGAPTYLIDIDVFRATGQPFDLAEIKETLVTFNTRVLQIFQAVVTPKLLDLLRAADE
jgi:uncharacterized protein (TIGR04255 family)